MFKLNCKDRHENVILSFSIIWKINNVATLKF